ncbi:hypothetical protein LB543_26050 [Mesorhizobium sp. ESP7-2]|uniref:lactonase family protein n=1 Tax=Mesorhizobium sp. ESP7-2 TaxID=2876622 RepID=UPI001CCD3D55|nr:hypothetical protein [Mesorhizobium sp. ESP7-2]MBZ9710174.1 hypothetical protein [Mesorhizobium sp. ESP7-2]
MIASIVRLVSLIISVSAGMPLAASAQIPDFIRALSTSRIVAISDGDFLAQTYATGQLPPPASGYRDLLTVLSIVDGRVIVGSLPISNSVTAAPEILHVTKDGRAAFVAERLGERPEGGRTVQDLPPGRRLFAVDLSDSAAPRLADTVEIAAFPEGLSASPDGRRVAVVSNTPEGNFVQIVDYTDGRFGAVARFNLAELGVSGSASTPRGGVTATNVHWHPSGRFLAVNINTQNRVAFFEVAQDAGTPVLRLWGNIAEVGADPFVGRFTPDGRYYLTSNWGRNFAATDLAGRIPTAPSTISVVRLAVLTTTGETARHETIGVTESGLNAEGIAISPDGRLVATVNMRGTSLPPETGRFQREASVTLLTFDPDTGALVKIGDYPFEGVLPEGGAFDLTGDHFLATVFQGHEGADDEAGAGLAVFRVIKGDRPALKQIGRIPLPQGVHHVDLVR